MEEKKYRKFEVLKKKYVEPSASMNIVKRGDDFEVRQPMTEKTEYLEFEGELVAYHRFSGNVRGYDVILVGGTKTSELYVEKDKEYINVETINKEKRKDITDLLVDKKKSEKKQEVVYFHDMEYYEK